MNPSDKSGSLPLPPSACLSLTLLYLTRGQLKHMGLGSAVSASVQNEIWFDDEILMQPAPVSLNDNSPFFNEWLSGFGCYTDKHQVIYVCVCECVFVYVL